MEKVNKKPLIFLRALILFVVFAVIVAALHWLAYHHYANVAEWKAPDSRDVLLYKGEEYLLSGEYATTDLPISRYKMQRTEGEVKIDDLKAALRNVILVASVTDFEDLIVVTYENGERFVYYKSGTHDPSKPVVDGGSVG